MKPANPRLTGAIGGLPTHDAWYFNQVKTERMKRSPPHQNSGVAYLCCGKNFMVTEIGILPSSAYRPEAGRPFNNLPCASRLFHAPATVSLVRY